MRVWRISFINVIINIILKQIFNLNKHIYLINEREGTWIRINNSKQL